MRRGLPRRCGLPALGARFGADVRLQRRGHSQRPGIGASRQGSPRGPHQHGRRYRHPARRIRARGLAGFARRHGGTLQAIEIPGRAGGAQGGARGCAGRDRQSVHARRPQRLQADADRTHNRRFFESPDAGLHGHRAQSGRRRRRRGGASARRRARRDRRKIYSGRRKPVAGRNARPPGKTVRPERAPDSRSVRGRVDVRARRRGGCAYDHPARTAREPDRGSDGAQADVLRFLQSARGAGIRAAPDR